MQLNNTSDVTKPSTVCPACREWERDMNGTLATLQRERESKTQLLDALTLMVRWTELHNLDHAELISGGYGEVPVVAIARKAIAAATREAQP